MKNILSDIVIGEGYIGRFIKKKFNIKKSYNSKNFTIIQNKKFNYIYLAAPSSIRHLANRYPKKDKKNIIRLINILKKVKCKKIICLSTIDTYSNLNSFELSRIKKKSLSNYGLHRLILTEFIKKKFKNYLIIKLPSLFGAKSKKGFFKDLFKYKEIKHYNSSTRLQWYYLPNLFKDIKNLNKISSGTPKVVNLISEPISCSEINKKLKFNKIFLDKVGVIKYNIKTKLKINKYFYSKKRILKYMKIEIKSADKKIFLGN
jgi:hypothetical protein